MRASPAVKPSNSGPFEIDMVCCLQPGTRAGSHRGRESDASDAGTAPWRATTEKTNS